MHVAPTIKHGLRPILSTRHTDRHTAHTLIILKMIAAAVKAASGQTPTRRNTRGA